MCCLCSIIYIKNAFWPSRSGGGSLVSADTIKSTLVINRLGSFCFKHKFKLFKFQNQSFCFLFLDNMFIFYFDSFNQVNSPYFLCKFPLFLCLFSFRNLSSPGHHSFIWSIDFINSWEIQVRDVVFVWVAIYPKANVNVPTVTSGTRIQFTVSNLWVVSTFVSVVHSHAQTLILASYMCTWAWETSGSIFTVFAHEHCEHIADGGQQALCQGNWYNGTFVMEATFHHVAVHFPTSTVGESVDGV